MAPELGTGARFSPPVRGGQFLGAKWFAVGCALLAFLATASHAAADVAEDSAKAQDDRIAELERTVGVLVEELERTRRDMAVPEDSEMAAKFGHGPGASKIYGLKQGLSIGGYGEGFYRKIVGDDNGQKDRVDLLRFVLYTGYKFTDNIIFNAEIEFEHATSSSTVSSGDGSVSVEFAQLDFMWKDWANFRAGLLLVPMGFINEIHEPPFYYGVNRPEVERMIIPSTWREAGVGVFGTFAEQVDYEAYVINGLNGAGFDSTGLRDGRQKGNRALAEHLAFVAKIEWSILPELLIGGSVYHGKSGQNQNVGVSAGAGFAGYDVDIPETPTTIWELHAQYEDHGLHVRSLFTMADIGDNAALTGALGPEGLGGGTGDLRFGEAVGGEMLGVYGELAYDVLPQLFPDTVKSLEPFFRYEYYDTQRDLPSGFSKDKSKEIEIYTVGLSFKPIPNVVIKADYRGRKAHSGTLPDEFNMGVGFVF
jgi:opacity protein-like surface antigen